MLALRISITHACLLGSGLGCVCFERPACLNHAGLKGYPCLSLGLGFRVCLVLSARQDLTIAAAAAAAAAAATAAIIKTTTTSNQKPPARLPA